MIHAQTITTNEDGEKIVSFTDGTWRFYTPADSIYMQKDDVLAPEKQTNDYRMFQRYLVAAVAYEADQMQQLDSSTIKLHHLEDQLQIAEQNGESTLEISVQLEAAKTQVQRDQRLVAYSRGLIKKILKIGAREKYEKLTKYYVPGLATIELTDEDLAQSEQIIADRQQPKIRFPFVGNERDQTTDSPVTTDDGVSKEEGNANEKEETPLFKDTVSEAPVIVEEVETDSIDLAAVGRMDKKSDTPSDTTKLVGIDTSALSPPIANADVEANEDANEAEESDKDPKLLTPKRTSITYLPPVSPSWSSSVLQEPPSYQCQFTHDGIDEFTQQLKREIAPEMFFYHTDTRLKSYLKDREYLTCQGHLTSISGGFRHLTLQITIASRNAIREYGYVKAGSLLSIRLLDGSTVSLFSQGDQMGNIDGKSGTTTYLIKYPIDYQKEKLLLKSEVDQVRIVWSTGYEDYEVYNVDFFLNQLSCLNKT